ncbi:DUF2279 domain-containing protein [Aegicerativicinus sediminis]|uniref:DUF2279 domain-containing protein n=1 Tax=Aegicerativicinus sediminis TaxID=2893202 RepID=UPI001E58F262|nr:DUF2279 domain-containing protein [Aegicerativicinus sediminis]
MRFKGLIVVFLFTLYSFYTHAQEDSTSFLKPSDSLNQKRLTTVMLGQGLFYTGSLFALNTFWYKDYDKSKFHTTNDFGQWLQVDKAGHVYSTYQLSRLSSNLFSWSGIDKSKASLYGAFIGFSYVSTIEVLDGYSKEWGYSWSDMAANALGTGLFLGQEFLWNEQRILLKYSYHSTDFARQRPGTLGDGLQEEFLKDYNGQTYWLSFNIQSFTKWDNFPKWLNFAIGYGGHGMLTGSYNSEESGLYPQDRYRQYYLSLDLDLSKIPTKSHFLRTVFDVLNLIKLPFTTVEFNDKKEVLVHPIYF